MNVDPAMAWIDKRKWWILAAVVFVASFFLRYDICEATQYHHFSQCTSHNVPDIIWRWIDLHNGLFVAIFTGTLWWTTSSTLAHLRREFTAEHRPWLRVTVKIASGFGWSRQKGHTGHMKIEVTVKNLGRSPARLVRAIGYLHPPSSVLVK